MNYENAKKITSCELSVLINFRKIITLLSKELENSKDIAEKEALLRKLELTKENEQSFFTRFQEIDVNTLTKFKEYLKEFFKEEDLLMALNILEETIINKESERKL